MKTYQIENRTLVCHTNYSFVFPELILVHSFRTSHVSNSSVNQNPGTLDNLRKNAKHGILRASETGSGPVPFLGTLNLYPIGRTSLPSKQISISEKRRRRREVSINECKVTFRRRSLPFYLSNECH